MKKNFSFKIEKELGDGTLARAGVISTPHGEIKTPAFVTVGTKATVKAISPEMVKDLGAQVVLANTYHLYLQPGEETIKNHGGIHKFMNWQGPTMTDSGGFQVFSLGSAFGKGISKLIKGRNANKNFGSDYEDEIPLPQQTELTKTEAEEQAMKVAKIDAQGVMFRSIIDGSAHYFTPEKSIQIQNDIGADIIFAFDECTSPHESLHYQSEALDRTHRWAKQCLNYHLQSGHAEDQALFAVVQGGRHEGLRRESARALSEMNIDGEYFDGYGIGGSFEKEDMGDAVAWVNSELPKDKPRHLLGIGEPEDLFGAVENGCDLFDCVMPTRNGRNGSILTSHGKINILNTEFRDDLKPIEEGCRCYTCRNYSRSYIAHLFRAKEMLAGTLASVHNLYFLIHLVDRMRQAILDGNFKEMKEEFLKGYKKTA
ncbi:MAG: tRNA guanosine(34) transglycosylase Tgt [bacterium]